VELDQSYTKGKIGHKSADLKRRQNGNTPQVIAYADKSNEQLRRNFYRMTLKNNINRMLQRLQLRGNGRASCGD
jgi:hypothetical protein